MEILSLLVIVAVLAVINIAVVIGLITMWSALIKKFRANQAFLIDWIHRTGMSHEARGETHQAIDHYERTLQFMDAHPDDFAELSREPFRAAVERLRRPTKNTTKDLLARKGRDVVTIEPAASVVACAQRMSDKGVGSIVIMEDDRMIGIVTRQDIMETVARRAEAIGGLTARDLMSRDLQTTALDVPFAEIEQLMIQRHVKHLPVVDGDRVVGIITRIDVLQRHLEQASALNDDLAAYIYGVYPR